jgi:glycine cleavage system H protein
MMIYLSKDESYDVPLGLHYTKDHEWLKIENGLCRIGVTDYAQKTLHEVVYVDLPKRGRKVTRKESLGTVESVKAVSDYFAPVGGEIVEVNDTLESKPELINKSPYGEGWIVLMKPSNLDMEIKELIDKTEYTQFLTSI